MPYIITTRAYATSSLMPRLPAPRIRRAVATLDEAQGYVEEVLAELFSDEQETAVERALDAAVDSLSPTDHEHCVERGRCWQHNRPCPTDGGTIGPLPDGTVIEVRQVTQPELAEKCGYGTRERWEATGSHTEAAYITARLIDAYNAR